MGMKDERVNEDNYEPNNMPAYVVIGGLTSVAATILAVAYAVIA